MREFIQNIIVTGIKWIQTNIFRKDKEPNIGQNLYTTEDAALLSDTEEYKEEPISTSPRLSLKIPDPEYYMFLDTETTGLPEQKSYNRYYEPHFINYYSKSRIIELGYMITDDNGNKIKDQSFIIKPDDFIIINSQIHGITHEHAIKEGVPIKQALETFFDDLQKVDKLICHNINFDINVLLSECYREYKSEANIIKKIKSIKKKCTMAIGQTRYNYERPPKLVKLYKQLFGTEPQQEHRALSDVQLCYECYFALEKI